MWTIQPPVFSTKRKILKQHISHDLIIILSFTFCLLLSVEIGMNLARSTIQEIQCHRRGETTVLHQELSPQDLPTSSWPEKNGGACHSSFQLTTYYYNLVSINAATFYPFFFWFSIFSKWHEPWNIWSEQIQEKWEGILLDIWKWVNINITGFEY